MLEFTISGLWASDGLWFEDFCSDSKTQFMESGSQLPLHGTRLCFCGINDQ